MIKLYPLVVQHSCGKSLVGAFNPSETYQSVGMIITYIWKIKVMFQFTSHLLSFPSSRTATEDLEDYLTTAARPLKKTHRGTGTPLARTPLGTYSGAGTWWGLGSSELCSLESFLHGKNNNNMNFYIYIYMYTYVFLYICIQWMCVYVCIYIYIHIVCIHVQSDSPKNRNIKLSK